MLYVNITNKKEISPTVRNFGFVDTVGTLRERMEADKEVFANGSITYNNDTKTFTVVDGDVEEDVYDQLFRGNEKKELEINKKVRNPEDDIVMVVDKFRVFNGSKVLFRIIPLSSNTAMIMILAGVMDVLVGDTWFPFCRTAMGYDDSLDRKEFRVSELLDFVKVTDKESGYEMERDGSSLVEMTLTTDVKGITKFNIKCSDFIIIDEKNRDRYREKKKAELEKRSQHKDHLKELQALYEASEKKRQEMLEQERKEKEGKKSGARHSYSKSEPMGHSEGLDMFRNMVIQAGYNRENK